MPTENLKAKMTTHRAQHNGTVPATEESIAGLILSDVEEKRVDISYENRKRILAALLHSSNTQYSKIRPIVQAQHFNTAEEMDLVKFINKFYDEYHRMPDEEELIKEFIEIKWPNPLMEDLIDSVTEIMCNQSDKLQPALDKYRQYAEHQELGSTIAGAFEAYQKGDTDKAKNIMAAGASSLENSDYELANYTPPKCDGFSACPWLENYIEWAMKWSPRTPQPMHAALGVWLLSAIAARRVRIDGAGQPNYPNIYLSLVAHTSTHAKTTATKLAKQAWKKACGGYEDNGLKSLPNYNRLSMKYLIDESFMTPEKFIEVRSLNKLDLTDYENMSQDRQEELKAKLAFIGQQSWAYSEFGTKLAEMKSHDPKLQGFSDIFLRFNDHEGNYRAATIGRGTDEVERPYMSALTVMTYQNFRESPSFGAKNGNSNGKLWNNGLLARFLFSTPLTDEVTRKNWPKKDFEVPEDVWKPLRQWHDRLGTPAVGITIEEVDKKRKSVSATVVPCETPVKVTEEVASHLWGDDEKYPESHPLHWGYMGALEFLMEKLPEDLHGNYIRLPEMVLRMAALFASFADSDTIEMEHYTLAVYLSEAIFRPSLHDIYETSQAGAKQRTTHKSEDKLDKALKMLERGNFTARELGQNLHIKAEEVKTIMATAIEEGYVELKQHEKDPRRQEYQLKLKVEA